ncbi:response regulator transcription factor [Nocardia sp. NPDC058518]|uniref:response regulator transcription factor n=1 Tax=Nocardia sp. NPDC058518 TaxID=3346534 RepID=UPI003657EB63
MTADSQQVPPRFTVLVVDDDEDTRRSIAGGLPPNEFDVRTATDGAEAIAAYQSHEPDIIVVDWQMSALDGLGFITAMRAFGSTVPICVISAQTDVADRVAGLEAGADDYLCKPFALAELTARLRALLRRSASKKPAPNATIVSDGVRLDRFQRRVFVTGTEVELTRREFDLLSALTADRGTVVSRERLLQVVWGRNAPQPNIVDTFICHLRRKLSPPGKPGFIHTVRGIGYVVR